MNLDDLIKCLEEIRKEHGGGLPVRVDLDWMESEHVEAVVKNPDIVADHKRVLIG